MNISSHLTSLEDEQAATTAGEIAELKRRREQAAAPLRRQERPPSSAQARQRPALYSFSLFSYSSSGGHCPDTKAP
ncbi:hypothetical protein [Corynebacterium simulans]|uniref:hypothetical protein n=1 Tax=Corynebacterium TaxID=1716 RepID=UPI00200403B8|nr:hypothetical protein [Corynebacterium simulans]